MFWSHFIEVLPLKDSLQKEFYITMAASERWGRAKAATSLTCLVYNIFRYVQINKYQPQLIASMG
ncbi:MAG: hypothetical protein J6I34_10155 [Prevotella sp.]|nr:hypothetical protein [Prevotella sp.]